jgi:hypothetical protein
LIPPSLKIICRWLLHCLQRFFDFAEVPPFDVIRKSQELAPTLYITLSALQLLHISLSKRNMKTLWRECIVLFFNHQAGKLLCNADWPVGQTTPAKSRVNTSHWENHKKIDAASAPDWAYTCLPEFFIPHCCQWF